MKFTIDTKTWLRGEGSDRSRLLRSSDGKMCCFGFLALACGIPAQDIKGQISVGTLAQHLKGVLPEGLFQRDPEPGLKTAARNYYAIESVNDNFDLSDQDRKERLVRLFKYIGIEVSFI